MKVHTLPRLIWPALVYAAAIAALTITSLAQITTTGIRGIVRDPNGAVITNATIKITDNATGIEQSTVSSSDGGFLFPNLQFGTYKLTAAAPGFQNTVIASITVESGRTTDVSVDLEIGTTSETVLVTASSEQLNTTTTEVGGTISNKLVQNLPYAGRDSLNFAVLIAGSARSTSDRNSTFNGLPNASLNITLDGMNNNSQRFKSGGTSFFAFAPARIDAIEEVSVSTTGLGADAGGEGAMQIRLTTKRGSDRYHGQVLEQFQNDALNANSFFRNLQGLPRLKVRQNNVVGSIGGPLLPFIPRFKNKLFFFAYYEAQPQPASQTSQTAVLTATAQQGNFTYIGTDNVKRTVNLLQAAGAAGFTSTVDPTIAGILSTINQTQSQASGFVDIPGIAPEFERNMQWSQATNTTQAFPTVRVDFQITPSVAWHGTWNLRHSDFGGAPAYPGDPYDFAGQLNHSKITTYVATNAVDWAIKPNIINNASFGIQSNGEFFFPGAEPQRFAAYGNRIINTPLIAAYIPNVATDVRNNPVYQITDNLSWVKGRHTLILGGTFLHTTFYSHTYGTAGVPQFNFGVAANDPVNTVLRNVLPNINTNTNDVNNALNLYALLTGRLTSITVNTNLDESTKKYVPLGELMVRYAFTTGGVYAQDSFRFRPNLTLNFGLRWQLDGAIHSGNDIQSEPAGDNFFGPSTGLFQPGVLSSNQNPAFVQVTNPYKRDFLNPAPNLGFAWNPTGDKGGFLGKLIGDRKTVIRGAYSITFYNEGLNSISNSLGGGRGTTQAGAATNGVQFPTGSLNLRSPAPAIPVFPQTFSFPIPQSAYTFSASGFNGNYINPNLRSPYVQNWSLGIQRQLTTKTVLELRYVGNKATHMWHRQDLQETNIFENGFLPQFIQAKKNLDINIANGRGNTFINNRLAGQAPIPIFEAAFGALGSQPAVPNGSGFGSAAFITNLNQGVAGTLANTLATNTTYYCRLVGSNFSPCANIGFRAAGKYPLNFFRANPFLNGMIYQDSNGDNNYNALQIDVRQQYGHGLLLGANYTLSHALGNLLNETDQAAGYQWFTNRSARLNYGPSPFDRRHVFNAYWTYELPFGKGRRFLANNTLLDRLVGGWALSGRETIASGNPFLLNGGRNTVNNLSQSGVVFGGGLTPEQLQRALSTVVGGFSSTALISDVARLRTSTGAADPRFYAPGSTPGQYAGFVFLRNNNLYTLDMSINKEIRIHERWRLNVRAVALNFLNHPFFDIANSSPTSTQFGQITKASGNRTIQLRASLDW
jgi:carboxypeptidase family protein